MFSLIRSLGSEPVDSCPPLSTMATRGTTRATPPSNALYREQNQRSKVLRGTTPLALSSHAELLERNGPPSRRPIWQPVFSSNAGAMASSPTHCVVLPKCQSPQCKHRRNTSTRCARSSSGHLDNNARHPNTMPSSWHCPHNPESHNCPHATMHERWNVPSNLDIQVPT